MTHQPLTRLVIGLACSLALAISVETSWGQAQLADELVLLSKGTRTQEELRGSASSELLPGSTSSRLGGRSGVAQQQRSVARRDVLAAATAQPQRVGREEREIIPATPRISPAAVPPGGSLDIPAADEEGPADGMSLDDAIGILTNQNLTLRTKFQEIPKADADILSAGLRGNPLVFGSVDNAPYGQYSQQRPGETAYGITIIQPVDINNKRWYRMIAAEQAKSVIGAQYQDAVRLEIDNLYTAYVDVLSAREDVRYVEASIQGLQTIGDTVEKLIKGKEVTTLERDRVALQLDAAELAKEEAQLSLLKAKRHLALLLNLPHPEESPFEVRGAIHTNVSGIPIADDAIALAHANRPDLQAYHLGVHRAVAEIDLAKKEGYPDVFVLYTPWGLRDNTPTGGRDATSWGISAMASIPIFNRNQGNIRRAELSMSQARTEWSQITRRIEMEVRQAFDEFQLSSQKAKRIKETILPRAAGIREKTLKQLRAGEADTLTYLQSQRDYVEVVRQYRDALVNERRTSFRINTAVGLRLVY